MSKVEYDEDDILNILDDLNVLVVSLDRIGSSCSEEEQKETLDLFFRKWKVFQKLAKARRILSSPFSYTLGEDDMCMLERRCQNLNYWSKSKPLE